MELFPKICFRYWLKYLKHNLQSGERWSRFEKVHKRDVARHSRWSPTTQPHSDIINLTAKMWSYTKNVLTILLFRKNFSRLAWQRWNSLEEHPSQRGKYFLQNERIFLRKTIIFLSIRLPLSPGEWLVEPGEAGDEEAEGARRNPSHHDPQVLKSLNSFELSIKFKQRNLLGHVPLVQFFHAGITSLFGCIGCTILMCIGCTILMRNGNSQKENNLSDSPAPKRTNNSPVKNTGWV